MSPRRSARSPSMLNTLSVAMYTLSKSARRDFKIRRRASRSLWGKRAHLHGSEPMESIRLAWENLSYSTRSRGPAKAGSIPAFAW